MSRRARKRLVLLLLLAMVLGLAQLAEAAAGEQRTWWWHRPAVQQELRLTRAQVEALDHIYAESLPQRRILRRRLDLLQQQFARALRIGSTSRSTDALVVRLTEARRRSNITRTMMLVRMMQVLEPDQRRRLIQVARRDGM